MHIIIVLKHTIPGVAMNVLQTVSELMRQEGQTDRLVHNEAHRHLPCTLETFLEEAVDPPVNCACPMGLLI